MVPGEKKTLNPKYYKTALRLAWGSLAFFVVIVSDVWHEGNNAVAQVNDNLLDPKLSADDLFEEIPMAKARHYCQIVLTSPGTLRPSVDNMNLSSKNIGGNAAGAQIITTNSSFDVSIDEPLGFTISPTGGDDAVTFKTSMMGNGTTNFSETPGHITTSVKRGRTELEIHLTAERLIDPFPAGQYGAELTLRCE